MDRERDRDRRPLDIPPEDQYGTGRGQSYRPGGARERTPPPRADTYRAARSPPRRSEYTDSYRGSRPRSRSPPRREEPRRRSPSPNRFRERERGDSYRGRPRSPPTRREDLPRDDLFRKDTRDFRDERVYRDERGGYASGAGRSPPPQRFRERSPLPLKRGRELSPMGNRGRSPKRERIQSPGRGRFEDYPPSRPESPPRRRFSPERRQSPRGVASQNRQRSRSPATRARSPDADWRRRPRSPSPQRHPKQEYLSAEENGSHSVTTSRRSSPPLHPSRMQQVDGGSGRPTPREAYDNGEPYRQRSPEPRRVTSPLAREYSDERERNSMDERAPPREPFEQAASRPPPTGPAGYRAQSQSSTPNATMAPPTGPAVNVTHSAHARPPVAPPSGPRSVSGPIRGDFSSRGRGGFRGDLRGGFATTFRGGRGGAPPSGPGYGRGAAPPFARSESYDESSSYTAPSGPRGSFSQAPAPSFRPTNNSTATTYPRTQRFANGQPVPESTAPTGPRARGPHPAISDLPQPISGGEKLPSLIDRTKLDKLQEEAERLRRIIDDKEAKKRKSLREWDRLSRETEAAGFRSQVAEEALRKGQEEYGFSGFSDYSGEGGVGAF